MYTEELHEIYDASQNNTLTFFVGAGVSALSNMPSWGDLIKQICHYLGIKYNRNSSTDDFLKIPQILYYRLNNDDRKYMSLIDSYLKCDDAVPNDIHYKMMNLHPNSFVTTNFDELLEQTAMNVCRSYRTIATDSEVPQISGNKYILKIHGDIKHANIVLKEEDYLNYSDNFKLIETQLKSIFATNTVVFIGYGLNDYNIKMSLNWTKRLLNDDFKKPIFIYTGAKELTDEELIYQSSRGIRVVDCWKIDNANCNSYKKRYNLIFNQIEKYKNYTLNNKTPNELLRTLYNLVEPFDKLYTLREADLIKSLREANIIISNRTLAPYHNDNDDAISLLILLNDKDDVEITKELGKEAYQWYLTIIRVFSKARIFYYHYKNSYTKINTNQISFANPNIISFSYSQIRNYIKYNGKDIERLYFKAFYLFFLQKYDCALELYITVAQKAFDKGMYVLYYLSRINASTISTLLNRPWLHENKTQDHRLQRQAFKNIDELFKSMPSDFRNNYSSLQELISPEFLYQFAYEALNAQRKLEHTINTNSSELGITSSDNIIIKINSSLHFLLGNGIILDIFREYKVAIKTMMEELLIKYAEQKKKKIRRGIFDDIPKNDIIFDSIDFFCFISYFDYKELCYAINQSKIMNLEFADMVSIEKTMFNIFTEYNRRILKRNYSFDEINSIEEKIRNLIVLLCYTELAQNTVEKILKFLLNHDFHSLSMDEKITFLYYQVYKRQKYSTHTNEIIEKTLIKYIDQTLISLKNNEQANTNINVTGYRRLANYMGIAANTPYYSRKLALKVSTILKSQHVNLLEDIVIYYWNHLSKYMQRKVCKYIIQLQNKKFDFTLMGLQMELSMKIPSSQIDALISKLHDDINTPDTNSQVQVYPSKDKFDDLRLVGIWCFLDLLGNDKFKVFLGYDDQFDFYMLKENFNFDKFNIKWLFNSNDFLLKSISEYPLLKHSIRNVISKELKENAIFKTDKENLQNILNQYFL